MQNYCTIQNTHIQVYRYTNTVQQSRIFRNWNHHEYHQLESIATYIYASSFIRSTSHNTSVCAFDRVQVHNHVTTATTDQALASLGESRAHIQSDLYTGRQIASPLCAPPFSRGQIAFLRTRRPDSCPPGTRLQTPSRSTWSPRPYLACVALPRRYQQTPQFIEETHTMRTLSPSHHGTR